MSMTRIWKGLYFGSKFHDVYHFETKVHILKKDHTRKIGTSLKLLNTLDDTLWMID